MEFGFFAQGAVPEPLRERRPQLEHERIMESSSWRWRARTTASSTCGPPSTTSSSEYSHISASEVFLPYVAARTARIHVGSAIKNITPPVNHPARIAERVAMLDHLSEGRFEFGTGRGSSTTEIGGFGITDWDATRDMCDEALAQILRMWEQGRYSHDGRVLLDAGTQRAAEAVRRAAPADVGRGRQPRDLREGGPPRPRRALLRLAAGEDSRR